MDESQSLLKRDVQGRVRTPPARREQLLEEFERSGLSGPKFAALVGVKYPTFAAWVYDRKKKRATTRRARGNSTEPAPGTSLRLVEAIMPVGCAPQAGAEFKPLSVHLGGGMRLEIADESQVRLAVALLKGLEALRPC